MASAAVLNLTDENFEKEVLKSDKPVLVDFWAVWCGPCRAVAPIVEALATEYEGKAKVAKLDVDAAGETAMEYQVSSIPTLIVFKGGQEVERVVGAVPKPVMVKMLEKHL